MIQDYRELVREISQMTGSEPPGLMEEHSPVLSDEALEGADFYLIGLIGGKDVGKSALVNALVGQEITPRTSFGPGTEVCIAYAHQLQAARLRELLEREIPGQYRIVTHQIDDLARQVLLDLPDIDSHYASHVEVTRRMLKHMLYPIWMQSVEKYADARPRELLAIVAQGNDPRNFIFCLNKVDQVEKREGFSAVEQLGQDYAHRLSRLLNLPQEPPIYVISAIQPEKYMLPDLRQALARQKPADLVDRSRKHATRRQGESLAQWVGRQNLDHRLEALDRLAQAAEEEIAQRIGSPLVDEAIPRLLEDPAYRLALADELMAKRVGRWPIVNVFHLVLSPLLSLVRRRLPVQQQMALVGPEELVDAHLRRLSGGGSVAGLVQSTFASLQQSSPLISRLYASRKLWESVVAEQAEGQVRRRLSSAVERQREVMRQSIGRRGLGDLFRSILTIGALLWFPFIQPLAEAMLSPNHGRIALLIVQVLGVSYLLKNVAFLAIYFSMLWLILKWDTQRRVDRRLDRWKAGQGLDSELSLPAQVVDWVGGLLEPIRAQRERMTMLVEKANTLRQALEAA